MNEITLYSASDIQTMQLADQSRLPGKNRVEEIRNFAKNAGFKRIGIANCVAVQKEANMLKESLSKDFEVFAVDCKCGKIPASEFLGEEAKGVSCNPAGQADFLAENKTELNVVLGLCLGHDMIFTAKSKAPSTTLIVKDREFKHNPMEIFK
ncbi:MAG TPA: DUF1847 domain-containing protein [Bacteroidales bacterium]|nr:DUF1847 domain-containing protein [Bacteroidales bacterium]